MPVFGNRMVVGTANYKHIQEHKAEMDQRETKLGEWEDEKRQRLARIRELNASTKVKKSKVVSHFMSCSIILRLSKYSGL